MEAKQHMISLTLGSITQYLTAANGMPDYVAKRLTKLQKTFLNAPVNEKTMAAEIHLGGKRMSNIETRNDAILLMQAKIYLELDSHLRPIWPYLADVIINKESNTTGGKTDQKSRVNTFIQTWEPKTHNLPPILKNMISKAKNYGVKFIAPKPSEALQLQMPLWHHIGADPAKRQLNNDSKSICLRQNHNVTLVKDAMKMIERFDSDEHIPVQGCKSGLHVAQRLNQLQEHWDPTSQPKSPELDYANLDLEEGDILFDTHLEIKNISDGFRVFTNWYCKNPQTAEAKAGGGIWFSQHDNQNQSITLPDDARQTLPTATAAAVLKGLQLQPKARPLWFNLLSQQFITNITQKLTEWDNKGFSGVKDAKIKGGHDSGSRFTWTCDAGNRRAKLATCDRFQTRGKPVNRYWDLLQVNRPVPV
ncbi:hypothetical protein BT96DRAFT_992328 [Gymnopus androsaceus JB14]|uniref:Uncharacterized protein n=1 Tax=Gymnopus androsaceus JB14 TaxID=1447944 RepID=A0A6A4HX23_9AGAR|nr:hypothetical protein BT96DRAFT_992328 [Gymnopus androsaceus JB14]